MRDVAPVLLGDVRPSLVVPTPFGDAPVVPTARGDIVVVPSPFTDIVLRPLGKALVPMPAAVDDPPEMQPVVVALIEPVPMLDCVPKPLQSVPADRAADWLIAPDTLGTDVFVVPIIGTSLPIPDAGDVGTWLPPPGIVVALGATALFGFAKVDGAMLGTVLVDAGPAKTGLPRFGTKGDWIALPGRSEMPPMEFGTEVGWIVLPGRVDLRPIEFGTEVDWIVLPGRADI